MYNFTFIIPFMLTPILSLLLAYAAIQMGLMPAPTGIIGISSMPIVVYGIMQGSWKIALYQVVATAMSAAIWLPFFKAADAQALKEEREAQEASSEAVATQAA
jgi:PTS system cellobiose-specific IIC component